MPVRFQCPECRSALSVTRRKIGSRVVCPKCASAITVPPEGSSAAAGPPSLPNDILAGGGTFDVAGSDLFQFEEFPELSSFQPVPMPLAEDSLAAEDAEESRFVISRGAIYAQAVLLLLIATAAFGLGYWLGGADARSAAKATSAESRSTDESGTPTDSP